MTRRSHAHLEVSDGSSVGLEYLQVAFSNAPEAQGQRVRQALEQYCGLDTEDMIWIVETPRKLTDVTA